MQLPYIASLKHQAEIDLSCREINKCCGIDYIIVYTLFRNKQLFVLSNTYAHLDDYYQNGMFKHDFSTSRNLFVNKNYYLCNDDLGISKLYSEMLRNKYSVYRVFYKMYSTPDFDLIFGAASKTPIADKLRFYKKAVHDFDNFAFKFIEKNNLVFKEHNPELKDSPYFNDSILLKKLLQGCEVTPTLASRERECLTLAAKGFTTDETANILSISKHTVEEYKKTILKKLNAVNMANAIYLAMKQDLLEPRDSGIILPNVSSIMDFRNLYVKS